MIKDKKLFGIFNLLDIIIILVVIAAVIFAAVKIKSNKTGNGESLQAGDEYIVEFYQEEIENFIKGHIEEGDIVKDALQSIVMGEVVEVIYDEPVTFNDDGQIVRKAGYTSVKVRLKANNAVMTNSGLAINSYNYFIGKTMEIRVGDVALYCKLSNIEKLTKTEEATEVVAE